MPISTYLEALSYKFSTTCYNKFAISSIISTHHLTYSSDMDCLKELLCRFFQRQFKVTLVPLCVCLHGDIQINTHCSVQTAKPSCCGEPVSGSCLLLCEVNISSWRKISVVFKEVCSNRNIDINQQVITSGGCSLVTLVGHFFRPYFQIAFYMSP